MYSLKGFMMRMRTGPNGSADSHVREIERKTRRKLLAEKKIRIVLEGPRRESRISELCRRAAFPNNGSKAFLKAGKNACPATVLSRGDDGDRTYRAPGNRARFHPSC